jgi:hypothetical protein
MSAITITLELSPEGAAGLKRFADKVTHDDVRAVLYPHIHADIRAEQASEIIAAFSTLERALDKARVATWPWIETGQVA